MTTSRAFLRSVVISFALVAWSALIVPALAQQAAAVSPGSQPYAPIITKVEPPNWWIHLTPDLMLLLSGQNLQATGVACNLPQIVVQRTQSTHGGDYLFVWLKFGANLESGTAVCRVTTPRGQTTFELPLSARKPTLGRFQGLAQSDVLYLIMPDRFADGDPANDEPAEFPDSHDRSKPRAWHGGDLHGIRDHLDYLKDLGVTALWLTPIVKNGAAQDYHGYGAVDLYAVDPHLGTLADYQNLVAAAHQQKMKIFFDAVPNHVGPLHPWVKKPPLPDWFHGTLQRHLDSFSPLKPSFYAIDRNESIGNDPFEALADPHAPESLRRNLTEGWFFGALPDMNTENPVVAQYLLQNSIWWIESSGLDGFRVDTFPYVSRKFWAGWHAGLRRIYPNLTTIGEVFHPDPVVASFFVGGARRWDGVDSGLSTVFDFPMFFALRDVLLRGAPAGRIAGVLQRDALYPHPENLVTFFANHDVPRFASAEGSSPQAIMLAFGLVATLRGIPELYYGDEIGMPGGGDPDNRRDFPGGWPDDPKNAFLESGRTQEQQELFATVRTLLRLRREHPALSSGHLWHLFSDNQSYVFLRQTEEEHILVIFNNAKEQRSLAIPDADTPAQGAVRFTLLYGSARIEGGPAQLTVSAPAQSLSIFSLD
jgi:glycosidase